MRRRQLWSVPPVVLVVAWLGITAVPTSSASNPSTTRVTQASVAPATGTEQLEQTERSQLGFESDLTYIRSIADGPVYANMGIPMTLGEQAEMDRRDALVGSIPKIEKLYASSPDYGGAWLDQAAGGVLHVALTATASSSTADDISKLLPPGESAVYSNVKYSLNQLQQMALGIKADSSLIQASGKDVTSNSLYVSIPNTADQGAEARVAVLYPSFPIVMRRDPVFTPDVSRDIRTGVIKGGEWVRQRTSAGSLGVVCTAGYAHVTSNSGHTYWLTAGHCTDYATSTRPASAWIQGLDGTRWIGSTILRQGTHDGDIVCDCGVIGPILSNLYSTQWINTNNQSQTFTAQGSPYVGQQLCHSGAASYEADNTGKVRCGAVKDYGYDCQMAYGTPYNYTLHDALLVNVASIGGDSGAPLGWGPQLYGILSGGGGSNTFFSRPYNVSSLGDAFITYS